MTAPVPPTAPSLGRMAKNASLYGLGSVLVALIGVAMDQVLSHYLSRPQFGVLGLAASISGLLSALYAAGLDSAAGRFWYDVGDDPAKRKITIGTFNTFLLVWLAALMLVQELAGPAIYSRFFNELPYSPWGRLIAVALLFNALSAVPRAIWTANEDVQIVVRLRVVASLLANGVLFALLWGWQTGPLAVLVAQALVPALMLPVFLRFAWGRFGFAWDRTVLLQGLAFGLPMVIHLSSHWALNAADRLVLEHLLGTDSVGLYSAAYNASTSALITINLSLNGAYVPQFMRAQAEPNSQRFVGTAILALVGLATLSALGFALIGPAVFRLVYAEQYAAAADLFVPLCVGAAAQSVYLVAVNGLFFAKRTKLLPFLTLSAGIINIGLCYWWIPRFGLQGAAWATAAAYVILAALFVVAARTATVLPWPTRRLLHLLLVVAAAAALRLAIGPLAATMDLLTGLGLTLAVPVVLWWTGFVAADDKVVLQAKLYSLLRRTRSLSEINRF